MSEIKIEEVGAKRKKVAQEISDTELSYVSQLMEATELYYYPVLKRIGTENEILNNEQLHIVFGNLMQLLSSDKDLLKALQFRISTWNEDTCLGDLFMGAFTPEFIQEYCTYVHGFEMYLEFMKKLRSDKVNIHPFLSFIPQQERKSTSKLNLTSLLITPVQRIPRYILLLQDLLKATEETHKDYDNLLLALENMKVIATHIDEQKGKMSEMRKLETLFHRFPDDYEKLSSLLSLDRRFIGSILVEEDDVNAKVMQKQLFFLNDYIICGQPHKSIANGALHLCWHCDIYSLHYTPLENGTVTFHIRVFSDNFPFINFITFRLRPSSSDDEKILFKYINSASISLKANVVKSNLVNSENYFNHFSKSLMNEDDWNIVKAGSTKQPYQKGEIVYKQGEQIKYIYIIEDGEGSYTKTIDDNQSYHFPVSMKISGEFEFLMRLLNESFVTSASLVAESPMLITQVEMTYLEEILFPSISSSCIPLCAQNSTQFALYLACNCAYVSITSPINTLDDPPDDGETNNFVRSRSRSQSFQDWKRCATMQNIGPGNQNNNKSAPSIPVGKSASYQESSMMKKVNTSSSLLSHTNNSRATLTSSNSSKKQKKYEKILKKFGITDSVKFSCKAKYADDKLFGTILLCDDNVCFIKDLHLWGNSRILISNSSIKSVIYGKEKTVIIRTPDKNFEFSFNDKRIATFVYTTLHGNIQISISNNNKTTKGDKYKAMKKIFDRIMKKYGILTEATKGEMIAERGNRSHMRIYQISSGTCKIESVLNDFVRTQSLRKGEIFGEISFFFGGVHSSNITAARRTTLRYIDFSQVNSIMELERDGNGLSEFFLYISSVIVYRFIKKEYFVIDNQRNPSSDPYSAPEDHYEKAVEQEEHSRDFHKTVRPKSMLSRSMCTEEAEDFDDDEDDD